MHLTFFSSTLRMHWACATVQYQIHAEETDILANALHPHGVTRACTDSGWKGCESEFYQRGLHVRGGVG